jgi:hypothetical protein
VLSGRGLCDELITRPQESYRLWCAVVCDLETSKMRRRWPTGGCRAKNKQHILYTHQVVGHNLEPRTLAMFLIVKSLNEHRIQNV